MLQKLGFIALAGALGSVSRFALDSLIKHFYSGSFPLGIALVNVLGCFIFGLIWALAKKSIIVTPDTGVIILTGFVGAFTTFSTLMFDTYNLANSANLTVSAINIVAQIVLGFASMYSGIKLATFF